jgi:starch synthase
MEIFHLSAECYPVAKVGGLADVVGALPKYLQNLGQIAKVVLPGYDNKFNNSHRFESIHHGKLRIGDFIFSYHVQKEQSDVLGFPLFIITIPELFDRPNVYSYDDDTERFTAFQIAFLNWLTESGQVPDVIHCHDHHTALVPFLIQFAYQYEALKRVPTVLTIHNGQYQGWFGFDKLYYLPQFPLSVTGLLEWNNTINPLAAGIKCAWKVTTVSPSYLEEMSWNANGLENLLRFERHKSIGILNGIDTEVWNPATDPMIEFHYDVTSFKTGKQKNKQWLCEQFELDTNLPLFVFIGRFVGEKGAELLPEVVRDAQTHFPNQLNILILGSGDKSIENQLEHLNSLKSKHFGVFIGYNETLAHRIYAGADYILMPSRVEPCGLNQLYALRYGTIPLVRRTGGLKDTVLDIGDGGWGFCHDQVSVHDINHTIHRAIELYKSPERRSEIQKYIMQIDHSWGKVALEYINLYKSLMD